MGKAKSEFMLAITQLAAEKNLPREVVLEAVEAALVSAFRKDNFAANQNISVRINPNTGEIAVFAQKMVAEKVADPRREVSLDEAQRIKKDAQLGELIEIEATPQNAGRIAAQTAKQVVFQRLREAEREMVFEEFSDREGEIATGIVQRIEPRQIFLDLGRTEGILPIGEQVRTERYRAGQRLKVYLMEVHRTNRGPQVLVSRTHRNLLRRLIELEVPEIRSGAVELKSVAREAGHRSKIAVAARQPGVDPIGSCVGQRGIRIQNIVNELNGEKIDIVEWHPNPATFIANALSPAQAVSVEVNEAEKTATVVVPDRQLSLAIGKEGQNARLVAKLTGWRIDIKSSSIAEAEKAALEEKAPPLEEALVQEQAPPPSAEPLREEKEPEEPLLVDEEARSPQEYIRLLAAKKEEEQIAVLPAEEVAPVEESLKPAAPLRFAEDIFATKTAKTDKKGKKVKAKGEGIDIEAKPKKARRPSRGYVDEEELGELVE